MSSATQSVALLPRQLIWRKMASINLAGEKGGGGRGERGRGKDRKIKNGKERKFGLSSFCRNLTIKPPRSRSSPTATSRLNPLAPKVFFSFPQSSFCAASSPQIIFFSLLGRGIPRASIWIAISKSLSVPLAVSISPEAD